MLLFWAAFKISTLKTCSVFEVDHSTSDVHMKITYIAFFVSTMTYLRTFVWHRVWRKRGSSQTSSSVPRSIQKVRGAKIKTVEDNLRLDSVTPQIADQRRSQAIFLWTIFTLWLETCIPVGTACHPREHVHGWFLILVPVGSILALYRRIHISYSSKFDLRFFTNSHFSHR